MFLVVWTDLCECISFVGPPGDKVHEYTKWHAATTGVVWSLWNAEKPAVSQETTEKGNTA